MVEARSPIARTASWLERHELVVLGLLLALAAVVRFVDLPGRGQWDSDQGHDMLVLRDLVRNGTVPLLGPPTSIGDFHHGALYYYLLAPFAWPSGGDEPVAILVAIAAANVAAVAATWWIARAAGGWLAGLGAALLMAVSASAIEESTFIWNPNIITLASAIAIGSAWRAFATGRSRWWLVAAAGLAVTMHSHVLGAVLAPAIAGLFVLDLRRRPAGARAAVMRAGLGGVALIGLSYVPLAIHEVTHDFGETRAAIGFLAGAGAEDGGPSLSGRLVFVTLRTLSWPLTGLLTDAPFAAVLAAGLVCALAIWHVTRPPSPSRTLVRWLAASLAWSTLALVVGARSLATVVPGFPNDHYHAFLDPIVFAVVGAGLARLAGNLPVRVAPGGRSSGRIALAIALLVTLVAFNVSIWPPKVSPDGGWPAAERATARIVESSGGAPIALVGLPRLKPADMLGYPLARVGVAPAPPSAAGVLVIACDRYLEGAIGATCGGPAEAAAVDQAVAEGFGGAGVAALADRFEASARTVVSVYVAR